MNQIYSLRPIQPTDADFLYRLFASIRPDVQNTDWTPRQKEHFLRFQLDAQQTHYQTNYPDAQFSIVSTSRGEPAGRLCLHQGNDELRIVELSLMPKYLRGEIESAIVHDIVDQARAARLPVRLHVARYSSEQDWYMQMGFEVIDETGTTFEIEWSPQQKLFVGSGQIIH